MIPVGIDKINAYIPNYYVDLRDLAKARNIDPDKFTIGIGQDEMAFLSSEEDIVTMAANAAIEILDDDDIQKIDMVLFATESAFDYSKSAATYLVDLLNLTPNIRCLEVKQACYSGTAAIQMAADYVRQRPERKVLVVTSDIARYGLNTPGEVTQGAGAIAMIVSSQPRLMIFNNDNVFMTDNQYDFWRPSYSSEAMVDGAFSNQLYIDMFKRVLENYLEQSTIDLKMINYMHFHLPYSKMGLKALKGNYENFENYQTVFDQWLNNYVPLTLLGRKVGNIYTGSLYLSFISNLLNQSDLKAGQIVGFFSYGSGAVAEMFTGTLVEGFETIIPKQLIDNLLNRRQKLTIDDYEKVFNGEIIQKTSPRAKVILDKIENHKRFYKVNHDKV